MSQILIVLSYILSLTDIDNKITNGKANSVQSVPSIIPKKVSKSKKPLWKIGFLMTYTAVILLLTVFVYPWLFFALGFPMLVYVVRKI